MTRQRTPVPVPPPVLRAQQRAAARRTAERSVAAWLVTTVEQVRTLAGELGVAGPQRVAVLSARPAPGDLDDDSGILVSATLAGPRRRIRLTRDSGPRERWAESVALWGDLRDAAASSLGVPVPISLVLALDENVLAGYEPWHCDDHGAAPTLLTEIVPPDCAADPWEELLTDAEADGSALVDRLHEQLDRYGIPLPSQPAGASCTDLGPDDED